MQNSIHPHWDQTLYLCHLKSSSQARKDQAVHSRCSDEGIRAQSLVPLDELALDSRCEAHATFMLGIPLHDLVQGTWPRFLLSRPADWALCCPFSPAPVSCAPQVLESLLKYMHPGCPLQWFHTSAPTVSLPLPSLIRSAGLPSHCLLPET